MASGFDEPVLIVDDDAGARDFVRTTLRDAGHPTLEVESGAEALSLARQRPVSAVVLDVSLPRMSGYEVCRALRMEFGEYLPIVLVSGARIEPLDQAAGLLIGADDYLVKPYEPGELVARLQRCLARTRALTPGGPSAALTPREREILNLLAEGMSGDQVARSLVISTKTVDTHIQRILVKLGVHSRAEAVAAAFRDGIADRVVR
jgi:DNA-binding NarL/FixJ family response regulator